jgi:hypothetical protein
VEVELADGRTLAQAADERYRGGPDHPFSREDLYEKFSDCAGLVLDAARVRQVFECIESLDTLNDILKLTQLLTPKDGAAQ